MHLREGHQRRIAKSDEEAYCAQSQMGSTNWITSGLKSTVRGETASANVRLRDRRKTRTKSSNEERSNKVELEALVDAQQRDPLCPNDFVPSVRGLREPSARARGASQELTIPLSGPKTSASCPSICKCSNSLARVLVTPSTSARTGGQSPLQQQWRRGIATHWGGSSPSLLRYEESSCGLLGRWEAWPSPCSRVGGR